MRLNLKHKKPWGLKGRNRELPAGLQNAAGAGIIIMLTAGMLWGISGLYSRADWAEFKSYKYAEAEQTPADSANKEPELPVSSEELSLLKAVAEKMREERYLEAARLLNNHEEEFRTLFYETLERRPCLYQDGVIADELEGEGLVLKKSNMVFYGTFENGLPQGELTALQAVIFEKPRYDYSIGTWKDGHMEGDGVTGYCYYDGADDNEAVEVEKKGRFYNDLLDGRIVYRSRNSEGTVTSWEFNVSRGVTVLDDLWSFDGEMGEYHLLSREDSTHALTIGSSEAAQVKWGNNIMWQ